MVLLIKVGFSLLFLPAVSLLFEAVTRGYPNCLLVFFLFLVPVVVKLLFLLLNLNIGILERLNGSNLLFT